MDDEVVHVIFSTNFFSNTNFQLRRMVYIIREDNKKFTGKSIDAC